MTVEVFTFGGGVYDVAVFNSVAAIAGAPGFAGLIKVVLIIAFASALFGIVFAQRFMSFLQWFVTSLLIYGCLWIPTEQVHITDRLNPGLQGADIANVPIGLAVSAAFTSQVGDYLTGLADTVFTPLNSFSYESSGFNYGNTLFEEIHQSRIIDSTLLGNLQNFTRQCVFYDIILGKYTFDDLNSAPDVWAFIGSNARSPARLTKYDPHNGTPVQLLPCRSAYIPLNIDLNNDISTQITAHGQRLYPDLSPAAAKARLLLDLPTATQFYLHVTQTAQQTLSQSALGYSFGQASSSFAGQSGLSSVDAYAQAKADNQTEQSYTAVSRQAQKWVPLLRIVLEVLFYGLFPIVFPLFLLPSTGLLTLRSYLTGFLYLQSWGPIYAIINMAMNIYGQKAYLSAGAIATGAHDYTPATIAGISAVTHDISILAGYMLMSIPFLAAGIAKGALAISSQATSFLQPSQVAAESAASDITSGNVSTGTLNFDNQSTHNRTANKIDTQPVTNTGEPVSRYQNAAGSFDTKYADGSHVYDNRSTLSNLGSLSFNSSELTTQADRKALSVVKEQGKSASQSLSSNITQASNSLVDLSNQISDGNQTSTGEKHANTDVLTTAAQAISSYARNFGEKGSADYNKAHQYAANAYINAKLGLSSPVPGITAGVETGGQASNNRIFSTSAQTALDKAVNLGRTDSLTSSAVHNDDAVSTAEAGTSSNRSDQLRRSINTSITNAKSASQSVETFSRAGKRLEHDISSAQSNSTAVNEDLSNQAVAYLASPEAAHKVQSEPQFSGFKPTDIFVKPQDQRTVELTKGLLSEYFAERAQKIAGAGTAVPALDFNQSFTAPNSKGSAQTFQREFNRESQGLVRRSPKGPSAEEAQDINLANDQTRDGGSRAQHYTGAKIAKKSQALSESAKKYVTGQLSDTPFLNFTGNATDEVTDRLNRDVNEK